MSDHSSAGLLLFVKVPEAGKVKTRLGRSIGFDQSCQLYRCFGLDFLQRLQRLDIPLLIFFAPDDGKSQIREWLSHETLYSQGDGDLGDRMKYAFEKGFHLGLQHLMIFGSDSPDVPISVIQKGFDALKSGNTVLGASNDGGYYTIGFSQQSWCSQAFDGIQWSSEQVYPDTVKILQAHSAPLKLLPAWDDIDTLSDLHHLYQRNQGHAHLPQTMQYIQQNLLTFMNIEE